MSLEIAIQFYEKHLTSKQIKKARNETRQEINQGDVLESSMCYAKYLVEAYRDSLRVEYLRSVIDG